MTPAPLRGLSLALGDEIVHLRCSTVADGDFHLDGDPVALDHRRRAFVPGVWTQLDEVHGVVVRTVRSPGEHDGAVGDALVSRCRGAVLSVWVGDCVPVVLVGADGAIGAAHAGWKGAIDGVLPATVAAMGGGDVTAFVGPCIGPCCYEFGEHDLASFTRRFGSQVAGHTTWGTPSLDMTAVVAASLAEAGVEVARRSVCTRCHPQWYYSHRRGDEGRQVMTVTKVAAR